MNATSSPCVDFVTQAIPFTMTPEIEELVSELCGAKLRAKRVAWIVLHLLLKPRAKKMVPEGEKSAPHLEQENFNWSLWLEICEWARDQQPPITEDVMRQVFERVCSRRIFTLEAAIRLIKKLSPLPRRRHGMG